MARTLGSIKTEVWAPGSDFRLLSPNAQWAYMTLFSQPQINNLGMLPYQPAKWARLAAGLDVGQVVAAVEELAEASYLIVDYDAGELLVRTFIRHDKVWAQPYLVTSARKQIHAVESDLIRGYLTGRHPWLVNEWSKQEIVAFESSSPTVPAPPPVTPSETSFGRAKDEGRGQKVEGSSSSSSSSKTKTQELRQPETAAASASETEPVSLERAVQSLALLNGWDSGSLNVVAPLLQQVPASWFTTALQTTVKRRGRNPVGLFVHLLQTAINDWRKAQNDARLAAWDALFGEAGMERVKREDPERYVLAWATPQPDAIRPLPASAVVQHVFDYVHEYVPDDAERTRLLELFVATVDRPPNFNDLNGWVLFAIDRAGRPLADVEAVLRTAVADTGERERLIRFAREIHTNIENERSVA